MNKTWTFIGGVLAGITSVFAVAAVVTGLEAGKGGGSCTEEGARETDKVALLEGETTKS